MQRRSQSSPRGVNKYCGSNLKSAPTSGRAKFAPLTLKAVRNARSRLPNVTARSTPFAAGAHIQGDFQAARSALLGRLFRVASTSRWPVEACVGQRKCRERLDHGSRRFVEIKSVPS